MDKALIRLLATREGGQVERAHCLPHNGSYTNGLHQYGAVSLLLLLHPSPSLPLIKAVQWHDVAERWTGDLNGCVKEAHPDLKAVYERIETGYLKALELAQDLLRDELDWLHGLDTFELWLWCREQQRLGNGNLQEWVEGMGAALARRWLDGRLPEPIYQMYDQLRVRPLPRLSDFFSYVERDLKMWDEQHSALAHATSAEES